MAERVRYVECGISAHTVWPTKGRSKRRENRYVRLLVLNWFTTAVTLWGPLKMQSRYFVLIFVTTCGKFSDLFTHTNVASGEANRVGVKLGIQKMRFVFFNSVLTRHCDLVSNAPIPTGTHSVTHSREQFKIIISNSVRQRKLCDVFTLEVSDTITPF